MLYIYIAVCYYLLNICANDLFTSYPNISCCTYIMYLSVLPVSLKWYIATLSLSLLLSLLSPLYDFSHFHFCFFILFLRKLSRADVVIKWMVAKTRNKIFLSSTCFYRCSPNFSYFSFLLNIYFILKFKSSYFSKSN